MRIRRIATISVFAAGVFFMLGGVFSAHHSQAGYDTDDKTRILKGVVVEYKWRNPHVFVVWDVKDDKGAVVQWVGEMPSVTSVISEGLSKNSLKPGDEIIVTGVPARLGTPECLIRKIVKTDGTSVYQPKQNPPREGTQDSSQPREK